MLVIKFNSYIVPLYCLYELGQLIKKQTSEGRWKHWVTSKYDK